MSQDRKCCRLVGTEMDGDEMVVVVMVTVTTGEMVMLMVAEVAMAVLGGSDL